MISEFKNERKNKFIKKKDTNNSFLKKKLGSNKYTELNNETGLKKEQSFNKFINYVDDKDEEEVNKEFNLEEQEDDFPALC